MRKAERTGTTLPTTRLQPLPATSRATPCCSFNVSPESLLEAGHPPGRTLQLLQQLGISPNRVVIELTEQTPIDDFDLLDTALHHYRAMGFSIALDDLGAGYSSLRLCGRNCVRTT